MNDAISNIVLVIRDALAALPLDPQSLARHIAAWVDVRDVRLVSQADLSRPIHAEPGERLFWVGTANPPAHGPGAGVRGIPVDLCGQLPWLGGDPESDALALIRAALDEAVLEPVLESVRIKPTPVVLVVGDGPAAESTVRTLSDVGVQVAWALRSEDVEAALITAGTGTELIPCLGLARLDGFVGRFQAVLNLGETVREIRVGAVVLCGSENRAAPALTVQPTDRLLTLSELEALQSHGGLHDTPSPTGLKTAFLSGLGRAATPGSMRRIFAAATRMAEVDGAAVYVFAPQIKVAERGLERLYGRARDAGVTIVRTPDEGPVIESMPDGVVRLKVYDPVARAELSLTPDRLVVEDGLRPAEEIAEWASRFGLWTGPDGFLGPDNVLFLSAATNRPGVFALGPARGTDSGDVLETEIRSAIGAIQSLLAPADVQIGRLALDRRRCAICLTCVRLCPHMALEVQGRRPAPDPLTCAECGLCAAECPMNALQLDEYTDDQVRARLRVMLGRPRPENGFVPRLVMFACRRSAAEAMSNAPRPDPPMDLSVIAVPCGGKVEEELLLAPFLAGADGVMVAACHEDNCRTQRGASEARRRTEHALTLLEEAGLEPGRLRFTTLAPNMGVEFGREASDFLHAVRDLGPNPISEKTHGRH